MPDKAISLDRLGDYDRLDMLRKPLALAMGIGA